MRYSVLWSGGLDSTFMIEKLLHEGHSVRAYYIEILNNENKTKNETRAIEELRKLLVFQNRKFSFEGTAYKVDLNRYLHTSILPQSLIFLDGLSFNASADKVDRASLGYVMNDDAISFLPDLKKYWKSRGKQFQEGLAKLTFPLSKSCKQDIIYNMDEKALKKVFWCEDPDIKYPNYCGDCTPCTKMARYGFSKREYVAGII